MNRREDVCPDYGAEQQTPPVSEAGGEGKVDRSVQGTVVATGFRRAVVGRATAEFQLWVFEQTKTCKGSAKLAKRDKERFDQFIDWIDDVSGCEECKQGGS
jgi:hypothetical protein